MSLTLKLNQLINSQGSIAALAAQKPNAAYNYTIGLLLKAVSPPLQLYTEKNQELLEKHGYTLIPDSNNSYAPPKLPDGKVDTAKIVAYRREFRELLDTDIELTGIGKLRASKLQELNVELDAQDRAILDWLIIGDIETLFEDED